MAPVTVLKFLDVDARRIVNDQQARIVTKEDVTLMAASFLEHGYIPTASPITVRFATAPEICSFYQRPPFNYTNENARKLTETISRKPDFDGHVYAYDGLIRKAAVLRMLESNNLPGSFALRAMLVPTFTDRQSIAYGLAQNSVNGVAIKLSPLEILLGCREYDKVFNSERSTLANQTEVARSMVNDSLPANTPEITKSKQAETRRQMIGICRKLPDTSFDFLRSVLKTDVEAARKAYTTANLKAVPKNMDEVQVVCLLKRLQKGYYRHMPKPKALDAQEVKTQAALTVEASRQIHSFQQRSGYDSLPEELGDLCTSMTSSQKYDEELEEFQASKCLFRPLVELCVKSVPGGDLLMKQTQENEGTGPKSPNFSDVTDPELSRSQRTSAHRRKSSAGGIEDSSLRVDVDMGALSQTEPSSEEQYDEEALTTDDEMTLPPDWIVECSKFTDFEKHGKWWDDHVNNSCDFASMRLPATERSDIAIAKSVTHLGRSLHATGVGHIFCTLSQYGLVENAVKKAGMYMARDGALYIYDATKIKRLTLAGQTQPIHQCAAVFWREPPTSRKKHHYMSETSSRGSREPGWVSVISSVAPPEKVKDSSGHDTTVEGHSVDLYWAILKRWCKPGGLCYDATAWCFGIGIAARDLGMTYIGVESDRSVFEMGRKRLLQTFSDSTNPGVANSKPLRKRCPNPISRAQGSKRIKHREDYPAAMFSSDDEDEKEKQRENLCALGDLCLFSELDQEPTHACKCGLKLHNMCDYGRRNPRIGSEDTSREMEWACSSECVDKYWPLVEAN